jgi:hypothetical protein
MPNRILIELSKSLIISMKKVKYSPLRDKIFVLLMSSVSAEN